jgi:hypothetical protein
VSGELIEFIEFVEFVEFGEFGEFVEFVELVLFVLICKLVVSFLPAKKRNHESTRINTNQTKTGTTNPHESGTKKAA